MNNLAPRAGLVPLRNCSPIDFDHGRHQRALSAITRQNVSPVLLRSLLAAELFPGFAVSEGRQYFTPCKLDRFLSKGEGPALVSDGMGAPQEVEQAHEGSTRRAKPV